MEDCRRKIILDYAKWTVLSAFRSGAPIKSRKDIYPLIDAVAFGDVLSSSRAISASEFDSWHEIKTFALCSSDPPLPTGWSVKLINIYLKTAAYIGDIDSNGLRDVLHPPIDSGLWDAQRLTQLRNVHLGAGLTHLLQAPPHGKQHDAFGSHMRPKSRNVGVRGHPGQDLRNPLRLVAPRPGDVCCSYPRLSGGTGCGVGPRKSVVSAGNQSRTAPRRSEHATGTHDCSSGTGH